MAIKYATTVVDGKTQYANDILVDLPCSQSDDFDIEVDGVTCTLSLRDAHEFCMDYGRDRYGQTITGGSNIKDLREIERSCGYVTEVAADA